MARSYSVSVFKKVSRPPAAAAAPAQVTDMAVASATLGCVGGEVGLAGGRGG